MHSQEQTQHDAPTAIHLRAANPDDGEWIEGFMRWGVSLAEGAPAPAHSPVTLDVRYPDLWPHDGLWIGEHDGVPVGVVRLIWRTETLSELELLKIDPEWQHTGLAEALVAFAVARAQAAGCRRVLLCDDVGDGAANELLHDIAWVRMERSVALALERAQSRPSDGGSRANAPHYLARRDEAPARSRFSLEPRSDAERTAARRSGSPLSPPAPRR